LDLPADPPAPQTPAIEILQGGVSKTQAGDGAAFLSQLMFYSISITASKRVPSTGVRAGRVPTACASPWEPALPLLTEHEKQSLAAMHGNSRIVRAPEPMQRLVSLTRLWEATRLKVSQELPSLFQIF